MHTLSLVISTYNRPDYLKLCLQSVLHQRVMPFEVIIADDGSSDETRSLIDSFRADFPIPLRHIWHPDSGFRLSEIRNKAIAEAAGDYIIQIDGDVILGHSFVRDHMLFMREKCLLQGSRVVLSRRNTEKIVRLLGRKFRFFHAFSLGIQKPENAFRVLGISRFLLDRYHNRHPRYYARGCNMSFFKSDFLAVNGYDESFTGWGHEDSDLTLRMLNNGCQKRVIKFAAVMFHLFHNEGVPSVDGERSNMSLMQEHLQSKATYIEKGVDKHLANGIDKDYIIR